MVETVLILDAEDVGVDKSVAVLRSLLCGVLCLVSMFLTACFALSFGNSSGAVGAGIFAALGPIVLVTIGVVLDLSKYVFWSSSRGLFRDGYSALAVVLMVFSWMASVAFFITNEEQKISDSRKETAAYQAYSSELKSLNEMIDQKSLIVSKRLESRFHEQWDKSDDASREIQGLVDRRNDLLKGESTVGLDAVSESMVSLAFFKSVGRILNVDPGSVRSFFYGVLALLIEVCSLALISLCRPKAVASVDVEFEMEVTEDSFELEVQREDGNKLIPEYVEVAETVRLDLEIKDESVLVADIKSGKVPPIFRKLKDMNYGVTQARIREILNELKANGVLQEGPRNGYVLAQKVVAFKGTR